MGASSNRAWADLRWRAQEVRHAHTASGRFSRYSRESGREKVEARAARAAAIFEGATQQIIGGRVVEFNAHAPQALIDREPPSPPPGLDDARRGHREEPPLTVIQLWQTPPRYAARAVRDNLRRSSPLRYVATPSSAITE